MRLFIALDVDEATRERLAAFQAKLIREKADVRWLPAGQFHVTIKFIGETAEEKLPVIVERLSRAAAEVPAFPLTLQGVDRLPAKGDPRVITVPVYSPDQRIVKLHRLVDSALGGVGFPLDTRALSPHITLGRVNSNHGLNRLLRKLPHFERTQLGAWTVGEAVLYLSKNQPGGSVYTRLHAAPLKAPLTELAAATHDVNSLSDQK